MVKRKASDTKPRGKQSSPEATREYTVCLLNLFLHINFLNGIFYGQVKIIRSTHSNMETAVKHFVYMYEVPISI